MAQSLQDQLVQAGLATKEQARGRRRGKPPRDDGRGTGQQQKRAPTRSKDAPKAGSGSADPAPSKRQQKRAMAERVAAVVASHGLPRARGEVPYRFTRGRRIKETWVSRSEQGALARGELALVASGGRYALIPPERVADVRAIDPHAVLVFLEAGEPDAGEEEHPVPDDLVW